MEIWVECIQLVANQLGCVGAVDWAGIGYPL